MRRVACRADAPLGPEGAAAVAAAVAAGGLVVFPTDTLYALGADPCSAGAVARVFREKGRGGDKPLPVLLSGAGLLGRFAASVPPGAASLAGAFWPGPLTILLPARDDLPAGVRSAAGEVALRVPAGELCRSVLEAAGGALTGTSANRSGEGGGADPAAAAAALPGADLLLDAGTLPPRPVSTIVRIDGRGGAHVVRAGAVGRDDIERALRSARGRRGGGGGRP